MRRMRRHRPDVLLTFSLNLNYPPIAYLGPASIDIALRTSVSQPCIAFHDVPYQCATVSPVFNLVFVDDPTAWYRILAHTFPDLNLSSLFCPLVDFDVRFDASGPAPPPRPQAGRDL